MSEAEMVPVTQADAERTAILLESIRDAVAEGCFHRVELAIAGTLASHRLAAEAAAIERFRETFADSNELLRQAMNALGTVDKNDPMEPIADNGMTVWDGMRAEGGRLWALYRKHTDDLKEGASHVG